MSTTHNVSGSMQDGRFATNYAPICQINSTIASDAKIPSWNSTEYRAYLQQHGLGLINSTFHETPCGMNKCSDSGISVKPPSQLTPDPPYTDDAEL